MSSGDDLDRERHETLYFDDGNVVFLAPRTGKPALLFRVHKSILCSHSPVFADMFDVCEPSGGTGSHAYDGVPLIHMADDANHLASILKILYYQSSLPWTPRSPYPTFEVITSILDLSRKYGIDRIHNEVRAYLESDWPQTLNEWDKLEKVVEAAKMDLCLVQFETDPVTGSQRNRALDDYFPEPASAIRLARRFEIPCILPAAFYHLSRLQIVDDWENQAGQSFLEATKRHARWGLLDTQDFRCLLYGRAGFRDVIFRCGYRMMEGERHDIDPGPVPDEYMDPDLFYCDEGLLVWKDIADMCSRSADPLALLKNFDFAKLDRTKHCQSCVEAAKYVIPEVRREVWKQLGKLFHLNDK